MRLAPVAGSSEEDYLATLAFLGPERDSKEKRSRWI
jgi:hypothetical protein